MADVTGSLLQKNIAQKLYTAITEDGTKNCERCVFMEDVQKWTCVDDKTKQRYVDYSLRIEDGRYLCKQALTKLILDINNKELKECKDEAFCG